MRSAGRPARRGRLIQDTTTPSRQAQVPPASTPKAPNSTQHRLNGLFSQGTYFCNCDPRLEAKLLTAGKDSKNPGKKFYGCVLTKCGFFLWEDRAIARSGGALASSSRKQVPTAAITPTPGPEKRWNRTSDLPDATQMPTPSTRASKGPSSRKTRNQPIRDFFDKVPRSEAQDGKSTNSSTSSEEEAQAAPGPSESFERSANSSATMMANTPSLGPKRKRVEFEEDLLGDASSDEERAMSEAMERSTRKLQGTVTIPETESTTPATERATDASHMSTLATARTLFPDAKRQRAEAATIQQSPGDQVNVTEEVMGLLPPGLEESAVQAIRQALDRHAGRLRGAIKGRDAVRTQLRAKEDRIAALQERVAALENKTKMQRDEITTIKAGLANLYSQH